MLVVDFGKRITAKEAMSHPYFADSPEKKPEVKNAW
jgi:hypothetical protein